jgi:hypothetical protein
MLRFCKGDPAATPGGELELFRKKGLHLDAGVAADEGFRVNVVRHVNLQIF